MQKVGVFINGEEGDEELKARKTRKRIPRQSPSQRSSAYRGVTRHRWTGRYEAHLWDKNCWNEVQSKKGKQVYLGAYDDEEAAARAYDLAALKYWGNATMLNFPISTYLDELKDMEAQSKEEYIGSLRRRSSGFSRGASKYRGVARHHHNGRWEARIGRVFGNKYLYLGTYATQEEAATAYDMAAIEYRGINAVTNFDLSRYIKWLRPNNQHNLLQRNRDSYLSSNPNPNPSSCFISSTPDSTQSLPSTTVVGTISNATRAVLSPSAFALLVQSAKFKETLEKNTSSLSVAESEIQPPLRCCSFPDDVQTFFEAAGPSYADDILGEISSGFEDDAAMTGFHYELDALVDDHE